MLLNRFPKRYLVLSLFVISAFCVSVYFINDKKVDFNTEVKPLLNKKCITCHGGVKRQSGFSLLFRQDALAINKSGKAAILPGDAENSEMIRRLTLKDPEERMPYKHPPLNKDEIALLKNWINQGAQWGNHWAYVPVEQTPIPKVGAGPFGWFGQPSWIKNNIDPFIYQKIKQEGLSPSTIADKPTLLRRVSFDIIGMPASDAIAKKYLSNNNEDAYEILVNDLLASQQYGEKWTSMWMDIARYADTKGFEKDDSRTIWRYRDWLIDAFNQDKPYNEFLTEQLAGDLLPNPSDAQYIATAFHRNTLTNDEGGTDNEEFRTAAVIDRVNTTWVTLMGTTFACVQCHSHPYDPFKHEEYYKFMALFNNTSDEDTYAEYPFLKEFHHKDSVRLNQLQTWLHQNAPSREKEIIRFIKTGQPAFNSLAADQIVNGTLEGTIWLLLRNNGTARLKNIDYTGSSLLYYKYRSWKAGGKLQIHLDSANGPLLKNINVENTKGNWKITTIDLPASNGKHHWYFTYNNRQITNPEESGIVFDWLHFDNPFPKNGSADNTLAAQNFDSLIIATNYTGTPIMIDNPATMSRTTNVFERGNWMVKGKAVVPDVPASLGGLPANAPKNRLGMAMWLTDKKNPLTARTMVNRIWEQLFGQGITETLEDFGTQGIPPTHEALLNYLAWQLMNTHHWSIKKMIKEIVMSATYQQDSKFNNEAASKDPYNKLYARGPRVRLSAEQVRDQALRVSGLLSNKMFGPSVMPYQPEGIWKSPYNGATWNISTEGNQYRRALYTFWKRSAPYPSMISFDGTSREVCSARRIRTNTPLQALNALNDSVYIEAAQHFAKRVQSLVPQNASKQISKAYELAFNKNITEAQQKVFEKLYHISFVKYSQDSLKSQQITGNKNADPGSAALIMVATALLNTDEFLTKN
jgi:hypothetical protein